MDLVLPRLNTSSPLWHPRKTSDWRVIDSLVSSLYKAERSWPLSYDNGHGEARRSSCVNSRRLSLIKEMGLLALVFACLGGLQSAHTMVVVGWAFLALRWGGLEKEQTLKGHTASPFPNNSTGLSPIPSLQAPGGRLQRRPWPAVADGPPAARRSASWSRRCRWDVRRRHHTAAQQSHEHGAGRVI